MYLNVSYISIFRLFTNPYMESLGVTGANNSKKLEGTRIFEAIMGKLTCNKQVETDLNNLENHLYLCAFYFAAFAIHKKALQKLMANMNLRAYILLLKKQNITSKN